MGKWKRPKMHKVFGGPDLLRSLKKRFAWTLVSLFRWGFCECCCFLSQRVCTKSRMIANTKISYGVENKWQVNLRWRKTSPVQQNLRLCEITQSWIIHLSNKCTIRRIYNLYKFLCLLSSSLLLPNWQCTIILVVIAMWWTNQMSKQNKTSINRMSDIDFHTLKTMIAAPVYSRVVWVNMTVIILNMLAFCVFFPSARFETSN